MVTDGWQIIEPKPTIGIRVNPTFLFFFNPWLEPTGLNVLYFRFIRFSAGSRNFAQPYSKVPKLHTQIWGVFETNNTMYIPWTRQGPSIATVLYTPRYDIFWNGNEQWLNYLILETCNLQSFLAYESLIYLTSFEKPTNDWTKQSISTFL